MFVKYSATEGLHVLEDGTFLVPCNNSPDTLIEFLLANEDSARAKASHARSLQVSLTHSILIIFDFSKFSNTHLFITGHFWSTFGITSISSKNLNYCRKHPVSLEFICFIVLFENLMMNAFVIPAKIVSFFIDFLWVAKFPIITSPGHIPKLEFLV